MRVWVRTLSISWRVMRERASQRASGNERVGVGVRTEDGVPKVRSGPPRRF